MAYVASNILKSDSKKRKVAVIITKGLPERKRSRIEAKCKRKAALLSLLRGKQVLEKEKETNEDDSVKNKRGKNNVLVNCLPDFISGENKDSVVSNIKALAKMQQETLVHMKKRQGTPELLLKFPALDISETSTDLYSKSEVSPPLFLTDLQQLLLYATIGPAASFKPRWCQLKNSNKVSSTFLIVLKSVSLADFRKHKECFPNLIKHFKQAVEMISPTQFGNTAEEEFFRVPVSVNHLWKLGVTRSKGKQLMAQSLKKERDGHPVKYAGPDAFPRTLLLLNPLQMAQENYPLPVKTENDCYKEYVFSQDTYEKVTDQSPLFGLDCEMCKTADGKNSVTRVSLVNEKMETVYDTLVKPKYKIIDYVFQFSGITPKMMEPVTTTLQDVQHKIKSLLPKDAILCGQSLNFDLDSLKMFHPYVIDTSTIYNLSGFKNKKVGLKRLTSHFLGKEIQCGNQGHSSVEDASASIQLVLLKLKHSLEFGDLALYSGPIVDCDWKIPREISSESYAIHGNRKYFFNAGEKSIYRSFFEILTENEKKSLMIDREVVTHFYENEPMILESKTTDVEAVATAQKSLYNNDFTWLQLNGFHEILHTSPDTHSIKDCFCMLDSQVGKLLESMFSKMMVAVLLTGRNSDKYECENAMTLVKIT